ncbi:hypothetical protein THAOC_23776, partial [Thalassiosira oceanica]
PAERRQRGSTDSLQRRIGGGRGTTTEEEDEEQTEEEELFQQSNLSHDTVTVTAGSTATKIAVRVSPRATDRFRGQETGRSSGYDRVGGADRDQGTGNRTGAGGARKRSLRGVGPMTGTAAAGAGATQRIVETFQRGEQ